MDLIKKNLRWMLIATALIVALVGCSPAEEGADGSASEGDSESSESGSSPISVSSIAVSATGEVVPAEEATLAFQISGPVVEILVEEGDLVQEGDVLIRLDTSLLQADVDKAQAGVDLALANLERLIVGPYPEQVAEAEANLAAAAAGTGVSASARDLATNVTDTQLLQAQTAVQQAYVGWYSARNQLDYVRGVDDHPSDYNAFEKAILPDWEDDALEEFQIATLNLEAAQANLDRLLAGPSDPDQRALDADLWAASADYSASQANLDLVLAGASAEDIASIEAQVELAQISLTRARIALEYAELKAPFSGTVTELYIRDAQYASAGVPMLLLADLDTLRVETTDLNEIDVASLVEGDPATIEFDALPGVIVDGTIIRIGSRAEQGAGVNFTVIIELGDVPDEVRWGMTAFVDIEVD